MKSIKTMYGAIPWLMALGLSGLIAACGGGGLDPILGAGNISPVTPPTVTVVSPLANATGVPFNSRVITAAFSKPMDATSITNESFLLNCPSRATLPVDTVTYSAATQVATLRAPADLPSDTTCTATVTTAVKDSTGVAMVSSFSWQFTTDNMGDTTAPTVTSVTPLNLANDVPTNTSVKALFSEAMDPQTINSNTFTLSSAGGPVAGTVTLSPLNNNATFTPNADLATNTLYTAAITTGPKDLAGNDLMSQPSDTWTFTTAQMASQTPGIDLNTAAPFGTFGGTAGMTNMGTQTIINGDIGTTATGTSMVTGFHDTSGDIYTETGSNQGAVNGNISTCTTSSTGPTSAAVSEPDCAIATQARQDARDAYLALVATPVGGASPAPGANLAGVTLLPGVYKAPDGSYMIQGGNLTLDAQGDANATWIFQMATTLTVGGPGAAFPQSIILAGGAQAKNVFWQVGSFATINAAGGGTMVGTIISQEGAAFSTAGNVSNVTLEGRVLSLGASVTLVNTVINVPQ